MPELPNRDEVDAQLTAVLADELAAQKAKLLTLLGDPPNTGLVPAGYWQQLAISMHSILMRDLQDAFISAANQHAGDLGHELSDADLHTEALIWALDHVNTLTTQFVENTKASASDKIKTFYDEQNERDAEIATLILLLDDEFGSKKAAAEQRAKLTGQPAEKIPTAQEAADAKNAAEAERRDWMGRYIDVPFSPDRGERMAVTSHTEATSAGERHVSDDYEAATGIKLVAIWHTEEDSKVCPICRPLDGLPEGRWPPSQLGGPPAHPNCRCWLIWEPAVKGIDYAVGALAESFDESKHPRGQPDNKGQWVEKGGGGSETSTASYADLGKIGDWDSVRRAGGPMHPIIGKWAAISSLKDKQEFGRLRERAEKWLDGGKDEEFEAMYKQTQEKLSAAGVKSVKLYRGMMLDKNDPLVAAIAAGKLKPGDEFKASGMKLVSFSEKFGPASRFASPLPGATPKAGIVIERVADAGDLVACHRIQRGFFKNEDEWIAKNPRGARVRLVAANLSQVGGSIMNPPKDKFPTLETVPIGDYGHEFDLGSSDDQRGIKGKEADVPDTIEQPVGAT